LGETGEIHQIEGPRAMDSLQSKKNSSKLVDEKSGKNTLKIMKKKNDLYNLETIFMHKDQLY
jgi:hypothetical protein